MLQFLQKSSLLIMWICDVLEKDNYKNNKIIR